MAENNEKDLKLLKANYDMYVNTLKETEEKMKYAVNEDGTKRYSEADIDDQLSVIRTAQQEVVEKYKLFGGNPEDLTKKLPNKKKSTKSVAEKKTILDMVSKIDSNRKEEAEKLNTLKTERTKSFIPEKGEYNPEATFDMVPLPSNGECYANKISHVAVAYLNAYDENMIVAPNLYRDNKVLDYILKEKILTKEINPDDLLEGDREAIILFLRASGYGNEYPLTVKDDITGKPFDVMFDLSTLKTKAFTLKGDENGYFDFTLPVSGKKVKFRFLTHKDVIALQRQREIEEKLLRKYRIQSFVEDMDAYVEGDESLEGDEKIKVRKAIREIDKWQDKIDEEDSILYTHTLTDRLELAIVSIDGNSDREYITDFIRNMKVKDSTALRKYINDNEPGIDYNIEIEKPEDLGGGSIKTFLKLNQFIFLNIS